MLPRALAATGCALQYAANLARRDDHVGKGAQTLRKLAAYQAFAAHHKMWRRKHLKKDGAGRWVPKKKSGPKKTRKGAESSAYAPFM